MVILTEMTFAKEKILILKICEGYILETITTTIYMHLIVTFSFGISNFDAKYVPIRYLAAEGANVIFSDRQEKIIDYQIKRLLRTIHRSKCNYKFLVI